MDSRPQPTLLRRLLIVGQEATIASRVMLAIKTAVAAAVAWYLAPFVPLADNDYSYYAPLGVLISMHPTLARSTRAGTQILIGIALGIALGLAGLGIVFLEVPGVVAVAAVIGLGILLGGLRALDAGSEWVAIAGLFVLLTGGSAPQEFSLSYLFTMAFGVVVGIVTNLVVFPPLYLQRASARLSTLRDATAAALGDIAGAMTHEPLDPQQLRDATDGLEGMLTSVAGDVGEAEESRKGNPRARLRPDSQDLMRSRLTAIERTTRAAIELADTLVKAHDADSLPSTGARRAIADATRVCGDSVAARVGDSSAGDKVERASRFLDDAVAELNRHGNPISTPDYSTAYAYAAVVCVRRIVDACREFVSATANA